jgi:hypothetical protein
MKRLFLTAAGIFLASVTLAGAQPPSYLPGIPQGPATEDQAVQQLRQSFPRLGTNWKVIAPASDRYNAWSHVLGIADRWLVPEAGTADNPFAGVDRLLAWGGYRRCATFDTTVRMGKQKVAVYATVTPDGSVAEPRAAALQHADGSWSCKLGKLPVIQVPTLEVLRGPEYGLALVVYERDVPLGAAPFAGR